MISEKKIYFLNNIYCDKDNRKREKEKNFNI